jgi:hypothetical protein
MTETKPVETKLYEYQSHDFKIPVRAINPAEARKIGNASLKLQGKRCNCKFTCFPLIKLAKVAVA